MAIFGFRQNNVLVSEAAVPASVPITNGRIYAEVAGVVNTGIAIANPNATSTTITYYFTDRDGQNSPQGSYDHRAERSDRQISERTSLQRKFVLLRHVHVYGIATGSSHRVCVCLRTSAANR